MSNLEKDIVGSFLMRPELFDEIKLNGNLFVGPNCRMIFSRLKKAHKDKRKIDTILLIEEFDKKIKECSRFIMSLTEACPQSLTTSSIVNEKIRRLKEKKIGGELNEEAVQRGKDLRKGTPHDTTKLLALCDELRTIQKSKKELEIENIPITLNMEEVEEEEQTWLWPNFIPSDALTLISGDPNVGKSWFALDMACRVSTGLAWPDLSSNGKPANVYFMSYEDSASKVLKKRIRTLGGDEKHIKVYNSKHPIYLRLSSEEGMNKLEAELIKIGNVRLLVIDPILDFISESNPNAVEEVRRLLTPIISMCERLHIACIMIGHLNKDLMKSAIYRAGGSTGGWMGKARAAFLIARDPDDKNRRYLMPTKCNYAYPEPAQMEFEILNSRLEFRACNININEILNPNSPGRPPSASLKVKEILADMFRDKDEISSIEVEERMKAMGVKGRTLQTVKKEEGYGSRFKKGEKKGDPGCYTWKKPGFGDDEK